MAILKGLRGRSSSVTEPLVFTLALPRTPGERLERSRVPVLLVGALMAWAVFLEFRARGGLAALDLDTFNLIFLTAAIIAR